MVDSEISFDKIVGSIKEMVDLTLLNPKEFDKSEMSVVSHNTITNTTFCMPHKTNYYKLKILQYVRTKSKQWEVQISDEFISNQLEKLIFQIKRDKKLLEQLGKTTKDWLEKLKKLNSMNLRFILPVNNVDYRKDIEFDNIKLKKLTLEVLKSFVSFHDNEKFFTPEKTLEDLKRNQTDIFAIIDVQAEDEEKGYEIAKENLKKLIHAMRLFDPPSGITEREFYFPEIKYPYIMLNLDKKSFSPRYHSLHLNAHIWRTKEYWVRVQPDWDQLSTFLYSTTPNQIQSLILTALYWYGDAGKETEDNLSKFLKYMHGLETLLIFDNKYEKGERMAARLAAINSKHNTANYDFYKNLMQKYYKFRSGMIHSGRLSIDNEDVGTTHNWLRNLLFDYIRYSKTYSDIAVLFQTEFSLDITT